MHLVVVMTFYLRCVSVVFLFTLQAFGVVIKLSDGILGLTLLAWGNSIGGQYLRNLNHRE